MFSILLINTSFALSSAGLTNVSSLVHDVFLSTVEGKSRFFLKKREEMILKQFVLVSFLHPFISELYCICLSN